MNTNILYDIYTINHQTPGEDLTISMAKYQADHPGAISHDQDKAIREFMGRHGQELADGFAKGPEAFAEAVAACEAKDEEKAAQEAREG